MRPGMPLFQPLAVDALIGLTVQLAAELAPKVRVNAVAPAVVKTRFAQALYAAILTSDGKVLASSGDAPAELGARPEFKQALRSKQVVYSSPLWPKVLDHPPGQPSFDLVWRWHRSRQRSTLWPGPSMQRLLQGANSGAPTRGAWP